MIGAHYLHYAIRMARARFGGPKTPLLNGFKVTYRCNLKCAACPFWQQEWPDVPFERAVAAMDQLHADGVRILILEGGEPFIWRDGERRVEDLVREAKRRFFTVGVVTNGMLPIETSADIVWVSLDGLRETHDALRCESFDRAIGHIKESSHPNILANLTINARNWQEIPDLVRFLRGLVRGITIQFYYPYEGTEDLLLSAEGRVWVLDQLLALKREGYPLLNSRAALMRLRHNTWRCHPWLISTTEPDGSITHGCYLRNRSAIHCQLCGFAAHAEISLAYDVNLEAIWGARWLLGFRSGVS
jgi:MoaA/NifB/PqqE/SkfB family radical SAM enzyme